MLYLYCKINAKNMLTNWWQLLNQLKCCRMQNTYSLVMCNIT